MERNPFQLKVASLLGLVACFALNFWLFRLGAFWGIVGLNVSKHLIIAYLCQIVGIDRRQRRDSPAAAAVHPASPTLPIP